MGNKKIYEVTIESGKVRYTLIATHNRKEAEEILAAYDNGGGCFIDENGFAWDLCFEEWDD